MIYLKAKIQDLLDEFEEASGAYYLTDTPLPADISRVVLARKAIIEYWNRGEA